jgi:hypothetical protein
VCVIAWNRRAEEQLIAVGVREGHVRYACAKACRRSAEGRRDAASTALTPELGRAFRAEAQAIRDALGAWHAAYDYYNLAESRSEASAVLPRAGYRRLRSIKTIYDPDQVIISTDPVRPVGVAP